MKSSAWLVMTTLPSEDAARAMARELVAGRYAACVSLLAGLRSIYRWEGEVQEEAEVQLLCKTSPARLEALKAWIGAHHPYSVPELLCLPVAEGGESYLAWIADETRAS